MLYITLLIYSVSEQVLNIISSYRVSHPNTVVEKPTIDSVQTVPTVWLGLWNIPNLSQREVVTTLMGHPVLYGLIPLNGDGISLCTISLSSSMHTNQVMVTTTNCTLLTPAAVLSCRAPWSRPRCRSGGTPSTWAGSSQPLRQAVSRCGS